MSLQVGRHTSELERAPRAGRACQLCHDRKVRCDVSSSKPQCTNCQRDGQRCKPRMRQRRFRKTTELPANEPASSHDSLTSTPHESPILVQESGSVGGTHGTRTSGSDASRRTRPDVPVAFEEPDGSSVNEGGFMGRSSYIAPDKFRAEDGSEILHHTQASSEINQKILDLQRASELPPRIVRDGLFQNFWSYCFSWDPIIDKSQVMSTPAEKLSPILLQAIFLAGSRMSSTSASYVTPQEFYNRAKTLFYLSCEQDPLTLLSAVSLLHWWNPHGPERISTDTSTFWNKVTIGLAQQIGLHEQRMNIRDGPRRRKLWWSLVARDCLISLAHGRPQAINPDDCDVPRLTVDNFPDSNVTGSVFIAYVELSLILGCFTATELRRVPSRLHQTDIGDSLYRWVKTLPDSIWPWDHRHGSTSDQPLPPHSFECRQLYVLYLVSLVLLYRPRTVDGPFPVAAVIASSLIASIFEEFLVRDEVRLLGPVFTFHLLVAAIALLSCYKHPGIWAVAEEDLKVINHAQQELLKKWPSALGSIRSFERMQKVAIATLKPMVDPPQVRLMSEQAVFFQDIDTSVCRIWVVLQPVTSTGNHGISNAYEGDMFQQSAIVTAPNTNLSCLSVTGPLPDEIFSGQGNLNDDMYNVNLQFGTSIGDWLFWDQLQSDFG